MSADHKRPLIAFVIVAFLCALIIADTMRSQAVVGLLRPGQHRVVAGEELAPLTPGHQLGREPQVPVIAPAAPATTGASEVGTQGGDPGSDQGDGTAAVASSSAPDGGAAGASPTAHTGSPAHQPGTQGVPPDHAAVWDPVPAGGSQPGPSEEAGPGFPGATAPQPHATAQALQHLGGVVGQLTEGLGQGWGQGLGNGLAQGITDGTAVGPAGLPEPPASASGQPASTETSLPPGHLHWAQEHPGLGPLLSPDPHHRRHPSHGHHVPGHHVPGHHRG